MNIAMVRFILKCLGIATLWLVLFTGCLGLQLLNDNHHYDVSSSAAIEGKFQEGMCMQYAIALSKRLSLLGIHGKLIFYKWNELNSTESNAHVFLRYRSNNGDIWVVDNETKHPIKAPESASDRDLIFVLSGTTEQEAAPHVRVTLDNSWNSFSFF
jgi:hypothetical protein